MPAALFEQGSNLYESTCLAMKFLFFSFIKKDMLIKAIFLQQDFNLTLILQFNKTFACFNLTRRKTKKLWYISFLERKTDLVYKSPKKSVCFKRNINNRWKTNIAYYKFLKICIFCSVRFTDCSQSNASHLKYEVRLFFSKRKELSQFWDRLKFKAWPALL